MGIDEVWRLQAYRYESVSHEAVNGLVLPDVLKYEVPPPYYTLPFSLF